MGARWPKINRFCLRAVDKVKVLSKMEQGLAYWDQKWNLKECSWHASVVNSFLMNYLPVYLGRLDKLVCRIFVPLCGKSHDLKW